MTGINIVSLMKLVLIVLLDGIMRLTKKDVSRLCEGAKELRGNSTRPFSHGDPIVLRGSWNRMKRLEDHGWIEDIEGDMSGRRPSPGVHFWSATLTGNGLKISSECVKKNPDCDIEELTPNQFVKCAQNSNEL